MSYCFIYLRFGQEKPVYVYRFLAKGTMEQKIYDRQVTKQSLSARVVDEQQIERHFTMNELAELYTYNDEADVSNYHNNYIKKSRYFTINNQCRIKLPDVLTLLHNSILQETRPVPKVPKDLLLAELLKKHGPMIWSFHDHDTLLENQVSLQYLWIS